jgi:hypothetical protein
MEGAMSERLYRAQILLDPGQHEALKTYAVAEGRSISSVAREVVDLGLRALRHRDRREEEALRSLDEIRRRVEERWGVLTDDALAEVRSEREQQLERVLRGDPE